MYRCDECKHNLECVCVPYGCENFSKRDWKKLEIEDRWKTSEIFGGVALGIIIETFAILFFKFLLWMLGGFI